MAVEQYRCIRKCLWGPKTDDPRSPKARKVYDPESDDPRHNSEYFDSEDPWIKESQILNHFVPMSRYNGADQEYDEQYRAAIAKGVKAPVSPVLIQREVAGDSQLQSVQQGSVVDSTKLEGAKKK